MLGPAKRYVILGSKFGSFLIAAVKNGVRYIGGTLYRELTVCMNSKLTALVLSVTDLTLEVLVLFDSNELSSSGSLCPRSRALK
jgi:hypothetical protein